MKYNDKIIECANSEIEFKKLVSEIIYSKLYEYAERYVDKINNTHLPPNEREHFCSSNILSIYNTVVSGGMFNLTSKFEIDDYHFYTIGKEQLVNNRIGFCYEILNTEDILNFLFLNFKFK